jgi:hypothetical protein
LLDPEKHIIKVAHLPLPALRRDSQLCMQAPLVSIFKIALCKAITTTLVLLRAHTVPPAICLFITTASILSPSAHRYQLTLHL